ncbi:hypothetical protein A0U91_16415 (plasmid) [Acetobacter persici]|uniref:Uncharacterized protein n=2 Tax=Acetobacter persici TaxID=1076596 RepID=A0A1U9LJJ3_9PROT|nr:hypothetical protein A0U91_16415 [Acetobacter persici]
MGLMIMRSFSSHDVSDAIRGIRNDFNVLIRQQYPDRSVKLCHIAEAVAASFGFNTYQGLKTAVASGAWPKPKTCLLVDPYAAPVRFATRLKALQPDGCDDPEMLMRLYSRATCWLSDDRLILNGLPAASRMREERDYIVRTIANLADLDDQMWRSRGVTLLNAIVSGLLWIAIYRYDPITPEKLERALTWEGATTLLRSLRDPLQAARSGGYAVVPAQELQMALVAEKHSFRVWRKCFDMAIMRLRVMGWEAVVFASPAKDIAFWTNEFAKVCGSSLYPSAYSIFLEERYTRLAKFESTHSRGDG